MPGDGQRDLGPIEPPAPDGRRGMFGPSKKLGLVLAGCGLVLLVGLGLIQMTYPRGISGVIGDRAWKSLCFGDDCRAITANKVTADASAALVGSFTVHKAGPLGAIHSEGVSGACLFVESAALNLPTSMLPQGECSNDRQCGGYIDPATAPPDQRPFAGWEGVCRQKTCWVRPGGGAPHSDLCNKGVHAVDDVPNPSNAPGYDLAKLKPYLADSAKGRPVKFRTIACLNGTFSGDPPCAVGKGDFLMDTSDPAEFSIPQ
jgi:hypothetical protein